MAQEFAENRPSNDSRSSGSSFDSSYAAESEPHSKDHEESNAVDPDVSQTDDENIDSEDGFDLPNSFSDHFYFSDVASLWSVYESRRLIKERNIDYVSFDKYHMISFIVDRGFLAIVTGVTSYCASLVLEFYCNLTSSTGNEDSPKFGRVFVRGRVFDFSRPSAITSLYGTPDNFDDSEEYDLDAITTILTGESQGFIAEDVILSVASPLIKIVLDLLQGNRNIDLPWKDDSVTASSAQATPVLCEYVMFSTAYLHAYIKFAEFQILNSQELIAHYTDQVTEYKLLLEVASFGQKMGEVHEKVAEKVVEEVVGPSGTAHEAEENI
ncbi:uncharacterized protein [Henckelia pumila]|uniref:uncharacterized protein n=1 Tax=Henckelia pumila TaxID=405737 RepID=UPI003C6DEC07